MKLPELLTGNSCVALKFRAVAIWSDFLNCDSSKLPSVLRYAADVALGANRDYDDWQNELESSRRIAEMRGECWLDASHPWEVDNTSEAPHAWIRVSRDASRSTRQAVRLDVIREAVAPYGITG